MSRTGLHLRKRLRKAAVLGLDILIDVLEEGDEASAEVAKERVKATASSDREAVAGADEAAKADASPSADAGVDGASGTGEPAAHAHAHAHGSRPEKAEGGASAAAKADDHTERTRVGLLKFVADEGGVASLADMHDHSAKTWFVAHIVFSRVMEGLTDEGLLSFDHDSATATLTDAGRAYIQEA